MDTSSIPTNGEYKIFYDNGQLSIHNFYRDGKREGECKWWYENGQLEIQSFYRNGDLDGEYKSWWTNGYSRKHAFYRDGKTEGQYRWWNEHGRLYEQSFRRNGKMMVGYFDSARKRSLLRIKRQCCSQSYALIEPYIIPDLLGVIV